MTRLKWERVIPKETRENSYLRNYIPLVKICTVKLLNIWTPEKISCNHPKIQTKWLYHRVMHSKDADGMANSVDPDQTAPLGATKIDRFSECY